MKLSAVVPRVRRPSWGASFRFPGTNAGATWKQPGGLNMCSLLRVQYYAKHVRLSGRRSSHTSSKMSSSRAASTPTMDDPSADLSERMRSTMRRLTNSVVICTSTHGDSPRAMTMSSFTSLSLSPVPLITFNIATPSRTLDAIRSSARFNIHILTGDGLGANLADHFTKGNAGPDAFEGLDGDTTMELDAGNTPMLQGEGVLGVLRCTTLRDTLDSGLVPVRDHVIVVGEVLDVMAKDQITERMGLGYADRQYRETGQVIPPVR